jgi:hypothetical protein
MKNALIIGGLILTFLAGYFLSQKYNLKVETKTVTPTVTPATTVAPSGTLSVTVATTATPSPEEDSLELIIKQLLIEKYGESANDMTVTVSQQQGNYARGGVTEPGGGGMWLAVRIKGDWQLVFDGNGVPDCTMLKTTYSFPSDMLVGVCD